MEKEKIDRINHLARESKVRTLTEEEKEEQGRLRREYLEEFRKSFQSQLDHTVVEYPDGTKKKLTEL